MSDTEKPKQDEIFYSICHTVLKLEVGKGHLKWTVSDISRESGVTRSLIYYYFGKEKEVILEEAYRYMLDTIFNLKREESLGIKERMKLTVKRLQEMPYLFVLYYLKKNSDTQIGELIRTAEEQLMNNFKKDYPEMSEEEVLKIFIMELGCIAYQLSPEKSDQLFEGLNRKAK
jgi:AcrR family transcriptional regulator